MIKWKHGPHRPLKKLPRWIWATLFLAYIIALVAMIIPFFCDIDKKVEVAMRPESARYNARWE